MKFIAIGRVHPERAAVDIKEIVWEFEGSKISVSCMCSQLFVVIDDPRVVDCLSAHGTAEHLAQVFLSSLGFLLGCGYKAEITQIIDEGNNSIVVGVQRPEVRFDVADDAFNAMFDEVIGLVRKDLYLRFAILDYTSAIVDKVGGAMFCYRAIESLAKSISKGGPVNTNWTPMHEALSTSKDIIEEAITSFAKPVRHGNWAEFKSMTEEQRVNMLRLTREIITKYIVFRSGLSSS